ncbi:MULTISPECIES: hypothetical protein [unclassified Cupriavidus]|uniref:hypothetical protein n=1 Tax=unclassified Cupriavidus TaxID=2640874 RepID=UPI00313D8202
MDDKRTETIAVKVRPELREWLARRAKGELRTMSAEACLHLEAAFRKERDQIPQQISRGEDSIN